MHHACAVGWFDGVVVRWCTGGARVRERETLSIRWNRTLPKGKTHRHTPLKGRSIPDQPTMHDPTEHTHPSGPGGRGIRERERDGERERVRERERGVRDGESERVGVCVREWESERD